MAHVSLSDLGVTLYLFHYCCLRLYAGHDGGWLFQCSEQDLECGTGSHVGYRSVDVSACVLLGVAISYSSYKIPPESNASCWGDIDRRRGSHACVRCPHRSHSDGPPDRKST